MSKQMLDGLFWAARSNPKNPMNDPTRFTGKHALARKLRAQAKRKAGRVVKGERRRGQAIYTP